MLSGGTSKKRWYHWTRSYNSPLLADLPDSWSFFPPPSQSGKFLFAISRNILSEGQLIGANWNIKGRNTYISVFVYLFVCLYYFVFVEVENRWVEPKSKKEKRLNPSPVLAFPTCSYQLPTVWSRGIKPKVSKHTVTISCFVSSPLLWEAQAVATSTLFSIKPWRGCLKGKAFRLKITWHGHHLVCLP